MFWSDVRGQTSAVEFLRRAIAAGRLPNSVLLWGPGGVGKRTAGRALAAASLCCEAARAPDAAGAQACGQCVSCREFAAGVHPDYLAPEIDDEARNISIATARELMGETNMKPVRSRRKVVLLPKAERLGEEAQNALLKSLEEPAGNTLWIMTAEDPARLLGTVRSRSSLVRFGRLGGDVVAGMLVRVDGLDEKRAAELAEASEGSITRARLMSTEDWVDEREYVDGQIVASIGTGSSKGPAIARALVQRAKARGARGSSTKSGGGGRSTRSDSLEKARRPALRLLSVLAGAIRDRMRGAAAKGADADFWSGKLQVVLESEAAIRHNVRLELVLTAAAARLAAATLD